MEETMHGMKASSKQRKLKKARRCSHRSTTKYGGFCCSCRLSISSPEETEADYSEKPDYQSAIVHAMVQKRLEKLIRETRRQREIKAKEEDMTNFMVCRDSRFMRMALAVDKVSFDLREDLKKSMIEMIMANEMEQPNELRRLLECYLSLNSEGCAGFILEVFHEVCSLIFMDSSSTMVGLV